MSLLQLLPWWWLLLSLLFIRKLTWEDNMRLEDAWRRPWRWYDWFQLRNGNWKRETGALMAVIRRILGSFHRPPGRFQSRWISNKVPCQQNRSTVNRHVAAGKQTGGNVHWIEREREREREREKGRGMLPGDAANSIRIASFNKEYKHLKRQLTRRKEPARFYWLLEC